MKRILLSILTIALVASATVSATRAQFSDTETSTGNTFSAGSLDLQLQNPISVPFSVLDIKPGDEGEGKVTLNNAGNLAGNLDIKITNLVQNENGCLEPEIEAGDPCDAGDLGLVLSMAMFLDVNRDGVYSQADGDIELENSGNTNTTAGLQFAKITSFVGKDWSDDLLSDLPGGLTPSTPVDLVIQWKFPPGGYSKPDAIFMTDSLGFDITFILNQITP